MTARLEFFFDFLSPYSYLASTQLGSLGVEAKLRPVTIVEVMARVNNQPSPRCPPKARYAALDAGRWAKLYGVPLATNEPLWAALRTRALSPDTLVRGALAAKALGISPAYTEAMFRAVWAAPADVFTDEGRSIFAAAHGLPAELWEQAAGPEIGMLLAADVAEAVERGIFGVPTFFVDNEMFFGNDRLDFVRRRLEAFEGAAA